MSEMVERVARAMCANTGTIWGGPKGEDDPDFQLVRLMYLSLARAAIEAMRTPTPAMVGAGVAAPLGENSDDLVSNAYTAMISQALNEEG